MLARSPKPWGPAQQLKCWSEDGNPRLSWNCTAPPSETIQRPPRSGVLRPGIMGLTQQELKTRESGGIQVSGACGPGLQGAWGPGPQGLGPGPPGAWRLFPLKLRFFRKRAETAASEVGTWRETKPGYPPYPPPHPLPHFGAVREKGRGFSPSPPSATIQHAPQGRRIGDYYRGY